MKIETATYSHSAIIDCIKTLKQYRFYASELSSVEGLKDLEGLHNYLHQKTGCPLFLPDWDSDLQDFRRAVVFGASRSEKDRVLMRMESYLKCQIADIYCMMQNGEVIATD